MKVSCILCSSLLVAFGICAAAEGLFAFDLLWFLCFENVVAYRVAQALHAVAAAWLAFWLIAFRPQDNLN